MEPCGKEFNLAMVLDVRHLEMFSMFPIKAYELDCTLNQMKSLSSSILKTYSQKSCCSQIWKDEGLLQQVESHGNQSHLWKSKLSSDFS